MAMTKREVYTATINILEGLEIENKAELIEAYNGYIEKLNTKSANKKQTDNQKANEGYKEIIVGILEQAEKPLSIDEIKSHDEALSAMNGSQKISALLRQLALEGLIKREMDGKKAKYAMGVDARYLAMLDAGVNPFNDASAEADES